MTQATSLMIGDARIDRVVDLEKFPLAMSWFFPDADKAELAEALSWLVPRFMQGNDLFISIQSFVLRLDGKTILIDTCVGEHKQRPNRPVWHERKGTDYLATLASLGLQPEDIDYVFCTHLHADHVGWNTRLVNGRWVPTFPNARYLIGRVEAQHWQDQLKLKPAGEVNHGSYHDSVLPIIEAGRADFVDSDHELLNGLVVRSLPGHTVGQTGLSFKRNGCGCLFTGDAIHHPIQLVKPDWSTALCDDAAQARVTRRQFLAEAAEQNDYLIASHFLETTGVQIRSKGDGYIPVLPGIV